MGSQKAKNIENKILEGLQLTHDRLIAFKIKHDQSLAYTINGEVVVVKARELHRLEEMKSTSGRDA